METNWTWKVKEWIAPLYNLLCEKVMEIWRKDRTFICQVLCENINRKNLLEVISSWKSGFLLPNNSCPVCLVLSRSAVNELFLTLWKVENGLEKCLEQFNVVKTNGLLSIIRHSSEVVWVNYLIGPREKTHDSYFGLTVSSEWLLNNYVLTVKIVQPDDWWLAKKIKANNDCKN